MPRRKRSVKRIRKGRKRVIRKRKRMKGRKMTRRIKRMMRTGVIKRRLAKWTAADLGLSSIL